jgi:hypothetical protein
MNRRHSLRCCIAALSLCTASVRAAEALWLEAELFHGIKGTCWPMGRPNMKQTDGHWGLSGPGWAAEWNQGGESGFLSIACGAGDDRAMVTRDVEIPVEGEWMLWVRYGDWREQTERFQVRVEQPGAAMQEARFGERGLVEEDNEAKLYWGWAFTWDSRPLKLRKGPAKIALVSTTKEPVPRQIDVLVLTTDTTYRPRIKERPRNPAWDLLDSWRDGVPADLEPLARQKPAFDLPAAWRLRSLAGRDFHYLWNVSHTNASDTWLGDAPGRVKFPYNIADKETLAEFEKVYGGKDDVPIFSDPRIAPAWHGAGPGIFKTDPKTGELTPAGERFARWLDANPDRRWGMMMNYHPDNPIGPKGQEAFAKYRDRYLGAIAGENLGYFNIKPEAMSAATAEATTRRELVEAFSPPTVAANAQKYRTIFGSDLDPNPFADVISCLSVENIAFAPLLSLWGCRVLGYESSAMTSSVLPMRLAFMRGAARQGGQLFATYRSCNFGDSATMFSDAGSYSAPRNIFDNYYSVFSGAGMTWYKFDIWYQFMAGSGIFYHEQGFDEFWKPGGTTAAGRREVELSPKGRLVDRFLRVTRDLDRGAPFTPVAFLLDYAHGWDPASYWPSSFGDWQKQPAKFIRGDHDRMLEEWFWTAYHPIGRESEKPMTALNEVYPAGVFGDMFDVVFACPDAKRWTTLDTYPVVIANGDIALTAAEGGRLAKYVEDGGTLLVSDGQLTGPGIAALRLPRVGTELEADAYRWLKGTGAHPSPRYRFRPIAADEGRVLATAPGGEAFCVAHDRGKGRLIFLSVPRGLGIAGQAVPVVARLFAHLTRGLMPVEVDGDVEWLVNRSASGWLVTMLNPAGQMKPQQGITPADYRENRRVRLNVRVPVNTARDVLLPDDPLTIRDGSVECEVSAGGVRIIQLR